MKSSNRGRGSRGLSWFGEGYLNPRAKLALLVLGVPLLLLTGFVAAYIVDSNSHEGKVARGVSLAGEPMEGSTEAETAAVVNRLAEQFKTVSVQITGPDDLVMQTTADRLGLTLDTTATVAKVMDAGGNGAGFFKPIRWAQSFFSTDDVDALVQVNPELGADIIEEIALLVAKDAGLPSMELNNGRLVGVAGTPSRVLDRAALLSTLDADLPNAAAESLNLIVPLREGPTLFPQAELDAFIDSLNAATLAPLSITAGEATRSFEPAEVRTWLRLSATDAKLTAGIDADLAQTAITDRFGDVLTLPDLSFLTIVDDVPTLGEGAPQRCCGPMGAVVLEAILDRKGEVIAPLIDGSDDALEALGIVELVGEFTTEHPAGQDRVINIQQMADLVRGVVLKPGEEFSINDYVGRRTSDGGFVSAGVINYGVLDTDVGGGVSQFATTMFNAAYFAGLDILDYQMHSIYFDRYPYGREATLSYPQIDLRVANPSDHYVLLWTEYTDTSITVKFFSTAFAEVEDLGVVTSNSGLCRSTSDTRVRTFVDGGEKRDTFRALYQPEQGKDCNGNSTLPDPVCGATERPVDTDGDGHRESCGPREVTCAAGEVAVDLDGDGFTESCQQVSVTCAPGQTPIDANGDGFFESCQVTDVVGVSCAPGETPADTNGDGVTDTCQLIVLTCPPGFVPVDNDGDGVIDWCNPPA